MEFFTDLPLYHDLIVMFVVADCLPKYAHFGALSTSFTTSKVVELFVSMVVRHHDSPRYIVFDRDLVFLSVL